MIRLNSLLDDGLWRVSVEDEGPGLSSKQCEHLFERFVRLATPDNDYPGTGLGLAICKSIVDLHRGRISAAPGEEARGLRVLIEIPAQTPEPRRIDQPVVPAPAVRAPLAQTGR
jgi:two-component system heavy metal sensor histidine kinase CusS